MRRKAVIVTENGIEYTFKSMKDAGRFLGLRQPELSDILNKKNGDGCFFTIREKDS